MATLAASTVAATAATALFLDYRLGFTTDIKSYREERLGARTLEAHIAKLGDRVDLYHLLELADQSADALCFEGRTWNYKAMKSEVDTLALGLQQLGVVNRDFVAVFMTNTPEMVFTVYALTKLGATPALINSALRDDTLLHCVRLPNAKLIISTPDLASSAAQAAKQLSGTIKTVSLNIGSFRTSPPPPLEISGITPFSFPDPSSTESIIPPPKSVVDVGALIYTSGTTGKPKACRIKNILISVVSSTAPADLRDPAKYLPIRTYSCMPLFHGTTFFTGLCNSVGTSGCFCLSRKFSARNFWREVTESRANRVLYVGELCRFLLATPPGEYDQKHRVQVAQGNGLQRDVWLAFQKRFNIDEVREFYRSTEGLVKFDNRHKRRSSSAGAGKIGYAGLLKRKLDKDNLIVKFDYDSEMPYRDPTTGFCIQASVGEPGEGIARIRSMATYTDYHDNATATDAKILKDVFEKGDIFQRSGDLLMVESSGWVRFVDRIGDTFRWKGENVSAGEIRAYISDLPQVQDAIVIGKQLKGYDGNAGVAAIVLDGATRLGTDAEAKFMASLYGELKKRGVPSYAFPRLVAMIDEVKVGDTFKHAKQVVKAIDWHPDDQKRKYWLDGNRYLPLDDQSWSKIQNGLAKL